MSGWISRAVNSYYNYEALAAQGQSLAAENGITGAASINAIAHALSSAGIAYDHSATEAQLLGNMREAATTFDYYTGRSGDYRWDTYKDLYNNQIGREIAEYALQNNLPRSAINDLIIDAFNRGDFIITSSDSRIPSNFSGWPGQFQAPSVWSGPSNSWNDSSWGGGLPDVPAPSDLPDCAAPFGKNHPSPLQCKDPLVLDLDGNGLDLIALSDSNAHFDYGGTGFSPKTGWVASSDGILVHDTNNDGLITAADLLGATTGNGFNELATLDNNSDGTVDQSDNAFVELQVWRDLNGNGTAESGELSSLAQNGISAINLNRTPTADIVNGNLVVETATFERSNGSTSTIAEINFATDSLYTHYEFPENFQFSEGALNLPQLNGYGVVPDLAVSASIDPSLETAVRALVVQASTLSGGEFRSSFENLVQRWAGVEALDPASRGPNIDARHIALVEAFYGATYEQANGVGTILTSATARNVEATYRSIIDEMTVRFASQIPLALVHEGSSWESVEDHQLIPLSLIQFDTLTDSIEVDFPSLVAAIAQAAPAGGVEQIEYFDLMAGFIKGLRVDLFDEESASLVSAFSTAAAAANVADNLIQLVTAEIANSTIIDAGNFGPSVTGTDGSETIVVDEGGHAISGGYGDDTYIDISGVSGSTTILDGSPSLGDRLLLAATDSDDVVLSRVGSSSDLTLSIAGGGSIAIQGQFAANYGAIETIQFADGVTWTVSQIKQMLLDQASAAPSGGVYGFDDSNDTILAGVGGKYLSGGDGNDTYVYSSGGGNATIEDESGFNSNADLLQLTDINSGDVALSRNGDSANVTLSFGSGDSIHLVNQLTGWYGTVETIQFANGVSWTLSDLKQHLLDQASAAASGSVYGYEGDDTIVAGAGGKYLSGGAGNDTYVYTVGNRNATIDDDDTSTADALVLTDIPSTSVTAARVGTTDDVVLTFAGRDSIVLRNQLNEYGTIEAIQFSDGVTWTASYLNSLVGESGSGQIPIYGTTGDDIINGTSEDERFDGDAGNDAIAGDYGSDTYLFGVGSGNDTITEYSYNAGTDTAQFVGLNASDLTFTRSGNDLLVAINSTGETLTAIGQFSGDGLDQIQFANGSTWDRATILSNSPIRGTSGDDTITGSLDDDVIDGGAGNDAIAGDYGSDTYFFGVGSGNDTITEYSYSTGTDTARIVGLNASDLTFTRVGNNLIATINSSGETLTVVSQFTGQGLDQIQFANGSTWDRATILANSPMRGTAGDDTINGSADDDVIDGGAGNDAIAGDYGSDTYFFGVGSGNDTITEYSYNAGTDTARIIGLNASDLTFTRVGNNLVATINSSGETLTATDQFTGHGLDQIQFANGSTWDRATILANSPMRGTAGNDTINGSSDDDVIDGGAGNDAIAAGYGSDTYLFGVGSGNDTVTETSNNAGTDTARFLGLSAADLTFTRVGNDLVVTINSTGESLTAIGQFNGTNGLDQVQFADGAIWNRATIALNSPIRGTAGNDTINGSSADDIIDGGAGNDAIAAGYGSDTYLFGVGSGNDTITEYSYNAGTDKARFIDLNASDLTFTRVGNDLIATINSTGETLTSIGQFNGTNGLDQVQFADGTVWDRATIALNGPMRGTAGNDTLNGSTGDDVIDGGAGNDAIAAGYGNDTYLFGVGSGNDTVTEYSWQPGTDTGVFLALNASDLSFSRSGNDLIASIVSTGETFRAVGQFNGTHGLDQVRFADGTTWSRDQISQNSWISGTAGNDSFSGGAGIEAYDGGAGNDVISGGDGNDKLMGGSGNDTLTGGAGNEIFVFKAGFGNDIITDFVAGAGSDDVIEFHNNIFADFNAVLAASAMSGNDTVITVDANNSIVLQNVALSSLHQDDFRYS